VQATSIYEPVQERLQDVGDSLKFMANQRFPFLAQLLDHVFSTPGKRMRPAITLLASNFNPHDERITGTMATAVELLHIATLIHDDTVDDSDLRRGRATVSNLWGRNAAVLVGDYIFAASATFVCDTGNVRVIRRFAETIMELSSGELQEMEQAFNPNQTMEQYLDRIYFKTASLFTTAGESGAILSGVQEGMVKALRDYSYNLGMAFQIVDDILDCEGTEEEIGKPVGNDLSHGIITLPALIALERYPHHNPIPKLFENPGNKELLSRAVEMVQEPSVIQESYAVANDYCGKALASLKQLPRNASRDSLEEIVSYVTARRI
jgi:geranylgeranyl pyrophosphate synthase